MAIAVAVKPSIANDTDMPAFCIIESDDGLTVAEHPDGQTAEEYAHRRGGIVVDPGPYASYGDAIDALTSLQAVLEPQQHAGHRDTHERIKRHHHKVMARLATVMAAMKTEV